MNRIELPRYANETSSWFGWYEQLVERVMERTLRQRDTDIEETQFLLAA